GTVTILQATGSFAFGSATSMNVGTTPVSVAIGDLDGDKKVDLAVANSGSNNVSTLKGVGNGTFNAAVARTIGGTVPKSVVIADIDGDGKRDIATANSGSNNLSILRGDGAGNFATATQQVVGTGPSQLAVQLGKNNKPNLVTANNGSSNITFLRNDLRPPTLGSAAT